MTEVHILEIHNGHSDKATRASLNQLDGIHEELRLMCSRESVALKSDEDNL